MKIQELKDFRAEDALVMATKYTPAITIESAAYSPETGMLDIKLRPIADIRAANLSQSKMDSAPATPAATDLTETLKRIEAKLDDLLDDVPTETDAGKVPLWKKWLGLGTVKPIDPAPIDPAPIDIKLP